MPIRPRRSALYLPASNPRALDKARQLPVDTLILDLEDAVAPAAKHEARELLARELRRGGYGYRERVVRVNGLDTPWGRDDLEALSAVPVDAVLLPKVSTPAQIEAALGVLDAAGATGLPVWIMAETALGILNIREIAACSPRLQAIVLGTSDLAKELRVPNANDRLGLLPSLGLCVLAARAHGLAVLDGVHRDLQDEAGYAAACRQGRQLGFDGKTLIHPRQIDEANAVFAPSPEELDAAQRMVTGWEAAQAAGKEVVLVDGLLVERLHVMEARQLQQLAASVAERASLP